MSGDKFWGKYRATVTDNDDPLAKGRLRVSVPDVLATTTSTWAIPCLPMTGPGMGTFMVPPVGAHVWLECEGGDPGFPLWTGGWWDTDDDLPTRALNSDSSAHNILLQTQNGHLVLLNDSSDSDGGIRLEIASGSVVTIGTAGITLKTSSNASITIDDSGITLDNGAGARITLSGPTVDVNNQALTVT